VLQTNRSFYFMICAFIFFVSCKGKKGAIINYHNKVIDLGQLTFKKEFAGKIALYNTGDLPLELLDATADCSCTVPDEIRNTIIQPNDSTFLKFKLTPAQDGYVQQTIYLDNTSVNENRVLFLIRAIVKLAE
jgi:hypothetical protein